MKIFTSSTSILREKSFNKLVSALGMLLLLLVSNNVFAQASVLFTGLTSTTPAPSNSRYTLNTVGGFRQVRFLSNQNVAASTTGWAFHSGTTGSPNYSPNWRPFAANNTLSSNTFIPTSFDNGAKYNATGGGVDGLLPTITSGNYYTFNVSANAAANNVMQLLETSYNPISISSVTQSVGANGTRTINITTSGAPNASENIFVRFSTDSFASSTIVQATGSGTSWTATIPLRTTTVNFYVYTSPKTKTQIESDVITNGQPVHDMSTLNLNNNSGANYSYGPISVTSTGGTNTSTTYTTLAAAITAINGGVIHTGAIVCSVNAGYTETAPSGGFSITASGTALNTITFQKVGTGTNPTFTANTTQTSGSLIDGIFKIIGGDYITIDGFTMLENANTTTTAASNNMTEFGVALFYATTTNGCQNITIKNCTIDLNRTYQNTFGIYANSTHTATNITNATATGTTGGNHNLTITGNTITDVNQGISIVGPTAAANQNNGLVIGGTLADANTITDWGTTATFSSYPNLSGTLNGVLVRNTNNYTISNNTVTSSNGGHTSGANIRGIFIPSFSNAPTGTLVQTISNNIISVRSALATATISGIIVEGTTGNATTTLNINANDFNTFGHTAAGTGAINFINNGMANLNISISNNTFTNISANTTGSVTFISNSVTSPATGTKNINSNSIVTAFSKTGAGGTITLHTDNGTSPSGVIINNNNNNFSNITVTGATTIAGWSNTDGPTSLPSNTKNVTGNTFSNWTGGSSPISGLVVNYCSTGTISGNTISSISGSAAITGISSANLNQDFSNNTIHTLTTTGASAVSAISISGGTTQNVFRNKIYNLEANNAGGSVNGLLISAGTTVNVYNNVIGDLRTPIANAANPLIGINITGGTTSNVFHNTVRLSGTSSGALFGSSAISVSTTPAVTLRNNIFINNSSFTGTGRSVAYRRSSTTITTYNAASNNNLFYAGTPGANNVIFSDGTNNDQTLTAFKTRMATRDQASQTENNIFQSTTGSDANFLRIAAGTNSFAESGAVLITSPITINTDYWNITRPFQSPLNGGTTPDIGASEFDGFSGLISCTTPTAQPTALTFSTVTTTTLSGSFTDASPVPTNYLVIRSTSSTLSGTPVDGTSYSAGSSLGSGTVIVPTGTTFTDSALTAGTMYYYFVLSYNSGSCSGGPKYFTTTPLTNNQVTVCTTATALAESTLTATSATLTWTGAGNYIVEYGAAGFTPGTGATAGVGGTIATSAATTPYVLSGLTSTTTYDVYVRQVCAVGGLYSANSSKDTFTTLQIPATLPYTQNFTAANDFSFVNGAQTNKWVYGTATGNTANSLYLSNDSGVTNAYTLTSASVVQTYKDIAIPSGTTLTSFSFDWKANGESTFDYLRVWLVPTSFIPTAGTQITAGSGRIQVGGNLNLVSTWQTYSNPILDLTTFANTTMRLVFEWRNDTSQGNQTPAAIDNISLSIPACGVPTIAATNNIVETTATINWTAPASAPSNGYNYEVRTSGAAGSGATGLTTSGTVGAGIVTANVTGLTAATTYSVYVQSDCGGNGTSSWSTAGTFTTACTVPNNPGTMSVTAPSATGFTLNYAAASPAPTNYILFNSTGTVATAIPTLVTGTTYTNGTAYTFDGNSYNCISNTSASPQVLTGGTSNTQYNYFLYSKSTTNSCFGNPYYSTGISVSTITCPAAPTLPVASLVTVSSATVSWTASVVGGNAGTINYTLEVCTDAGYTTPISGSPFSMGTSVSQALTGLSAATTYYYRVKANNGSCDSTYLTGTLTTACGAITSFPSVEPFASYLPSACWTEGDLGDLTAGPATTGASVSDWGVDGFLNSGTTGAAKMNIFAATGSNWIISPYYTIPATGYRVKYSVGATQFDFTTALTTAWESDDFVELLVSTSNTNWTVLKTYNSANVPSYLGQTDDVDLTAYNGQTVHFAFRAFEGAANGSADIDFFIDNFTVEQTPPCLPATINATTVITSATATINWTASASAPSNGYNYEVRTSGAAGSGATGLTTSGTVGAGIVTANVTGLTAATTYSVYVQSDCGGNGTSSWSTAGTFTTLCDIITSFPYIMAFDGSADCWTTSTGTAPWALGTTSTDITTPQSGSGFIYKPYTTSTQYLYSAPMDLSSLGSNQARLNFWIYRHSVTVIADQISFKLNTTNSNSGATNLQTYKILSTQAPAEAASGWYNYKVDIPTSWNSAGTVYIVIEGITTAGSLSYDIGLDNFIVEQKPPSITITPSAPAICNGDSVSLTASSAAGYTYTWTPATGLSATTGATVSANPTTTTTYTVTGVSGTISTTQTVTVTVNPAPSAVTITPSATTCPNVVTTLTASSAGVGTYTVGTSNGNSVAANTPYRQNTSAANQSRVQYLISKTELNAAGINSATNLTSLGFNVTTAGTGTISNYTISMTNTNLTVLTATYQTPTFTTVFTGTNILPVSGINTHTFSSPFAWDGTSNILINICHQGASGTASAVSIATPTNVSTTSGGGNNQCNLTTGGATNANRPVMTFGVGSLITWTPTTDLYTDSGATTAYTGTVAGTVYAKPTATTTYTATATLGSCTKTNTTTITTKIPVGITSVTAGASPICSTATTSLTANGVVGTNYTITWYTGAGGTGTNLGTGLTLSNVGPGTYYAYVTGDCGTPAEASITVGTKVTVGITSITAVSNSVCSTETTTLTANGVVGTNNLITWYTGAGGTGSSLGTGATLTAGPGTYYAYVTGDCGSPVEASITIGTKVNVGITNVSAAANPICATATTTLTANGVVGTNTVVTWWTGSGGTGTNLGTGLTISVGPGNYYARVTGDCGTPQEANYFINTTAVPTYVNLQFPGSGSTCQGGTFTSYGQVYQAGITEAAGAGSGITAQFGYSTSNTDPSTWTDWSNATFNVQSGNNDEYTYTFSPPTSGTYYYTYRYRQGTCDWLYGSYWNGTSNVNGELTVNPTLTASVSVTASATTICPGTSVTFTATPTNGGAAPSYQWYVGTTAVGSNSDTFTTSTLTNEDTVSVVMTSNATPCLAGSPATSSGIIMTVNPTLTASVSIAASATTICPGTSVTFTATPTNGGAAPSYQWYVGTTAVGTNSDTFTTSTLTNGDTVSVVMTSNATPCLAGSPATSSEITMTVSNNTSWTGAVSNLWSNGANWSCGSVPLDTSIITISNGTPTLDEDFTVANSGSLTLNGTASLIINSNASLTIEGTADFNDRPVTFKSDNNGTAAFGTLTGTLNGATNVTTERYFSARRAFRFTSSAVTTTTPIRTNWQEGVNNSNTTFANNQNPNPGFGTHITGAGGSANGFDTTISNASSLFTYNNSTSVWTAVANTSTNTLNAGIPYRINVRGDRSIDMSLTNPTATATVLRATGTLYTGPFSPGNLSATTYAYNLVGNPYQAPVNMKTVLDNATNLINSIYYVWDPKMGSRGAYISVDLNTNTPNNITSYSNKFLQPGLACFVRTAASGGTPAMNFQESYKDLTASNGLVFKNTNQSITATSNIKMRLYDSNSLALNQTALDGSIIFFDDLYNNGVDQNDGAKFTNPDEMFSTFNNGALISIEKRMQPTSADIIPIRISQYRGTNYTIVAQGENLNGIPAYLHDQFLQTYTEIPQSGAVNYPYTVVTTNTQTTATDRFRIVYSNPLLSTANNEWKNFTLYPNPSKQGNFNIILGQPLDNGKITIYNTLGVKVYSQDLENTIENSINPKQSMPTGVYYVEIQNGSERSIKKLIIE